MPNQVIVGGKQIALQVPKIDLTLASRKAGGKYHKPSGMLIGPGPGSLVAGTTERGWFGAIAASELITGLALKTSIGLSGGSDQNSTSGWFKFAHKGKVLFVAEKTFYHTVSWNQINNRQAVDGSRQIAIGGRIYKVRLMMGGNADPATARGGEWEDLLVPLTNGQWASKTGAEVGVSGDGRATWCQEQGSTSARRLLRGWGGNMSGFEVAQPASYSSNIVGWRPVLELVSE